MNYAPPVVFANWQFEQLVKNHNECVKVMREAAKVDWDELMRVTPKEGE